MIENPYRAPAEIEEEMAAPQRRPDRSDAIYWAFITAIACPALYLTLSGDSPANSRATQLLICLSLIWLITFSAILSVQAYRGGEPPSLIVAICWAAFFLLIFVVQAVRDA